MVGANRSHTRLTYVWNGPPIGLVVLVILGSGNRSGRGETDNPAYLTVADELPRLSVGGLVLKVLCHPPNEALRPILRNVFSYEVNPSRNVFRDWFLAQNVLSSGERFQYNLRLFGDRKDDDNCVDVGPCQECVDGVLWVGIMVDRRTRSVWTQSGSHERGEVSRAAFGARVDGFNDDLIAEGGQAGNVRLGDEVVR